MDVSKTHVRGILQDLRLKQLDGMLDTLLAPHVGEGEGAGDANSLDPKGKQLEHIGAIPNTAISIDIDLLEDLRGLLIDLESDFKGGGNVVELAGTVVRQKDGRGAVGHGELGILDGLDALGDDRQAGHVLKVLVVVPRDEGVAGVRRGDIVAGGAVTVTIAGRVDSEEDGLAAGGLDVVEVLQSVGVGAFVVELVCRNLALSLGPRDLVEALGGVHGGDVEHVLLGGSADDVELGRLVGIAGAAPGAEEKRCREVVAKEGGVHGVGHIGDVNEHARLPGHPGEGFHVVAE